MPTVIGINKVPQGIQKLPGFRANLGQMYGTQYAKLEDALLALLTKGAYQGGIGQVPTSPTPTNPGQLTFPSGATTQTNPLEMAQLQQMGGVPTRQGGVGPTQQMTPLQTGGATYQQPTRWGMLPNLDRQSTEADIAYKQAQTQSMTPEFQANLLRRVQGLPPIGEATLSSITPAHVQQIETDAMAGDEDAIAAYRYLKKLGAL